MSQVDEDRSIYNGHFELAILIDRPIDDVWTRMVDLSSWVTSHDIEIVRGEPVALGTITRVSPRGPGQADSPPAPYHYCKIIKLAPPHQYMLKTYSEAGGSYGLRMAGFDDLRLLTVAGRTRVTFSIFIEMQGELIAKDPQAMNLEASREGMSKNLANLKRLVESR
jgi:hypothetical protein